MAFKGMKIRIKSPEHSEKVQKALFELGYEWLDRTQEIKCCYSSFLYILVDGTFGHSCKPEDFKKDPSKEVELVEETKYSFVPVAAPSQEEAPAQIPVKEKKPKKGKFKNTIAAKQIIAYAEANGLDPKPILSSAKFYTKMAQNDPDFKGAWNDIKNGVQRNLGFIFRWERTVQGEEYWKKINISTRHIIE